MWAERRLGELLKAGQEAGQIAKQGKPKNVKVMADDLYPAKLAELGITKNESARAQRLVPARVGRGKKLVA